MKHIRISLNILKCIVAVLVAVALVACGGGTRLSSSTGFLKVTPSSSNFGNISVGSSSVQTVTLSNTGNASLTVSQANLTGTGFSVSGLSLPLTLAAGQTSSFSIQFAPEAAGDVTGSFALVSNASNSPTTVSLTGSGVAGVPPGQPELPRLSVDTSMPLQTGSIINVPAGGDFQGAINSATCGDTIQLQAGATFVGNFTLPNKSCTGWIIIRSDTADVNLPAPGIRVTPGFASVMPKLQATSANQAVLALAGAHNYRFIGVEFNLAAGALNNTAIVDIDPADDPALGCPTCTLTVATQAKFIFLDRCYVHGNPNDSVNAGVSMQADSGAVFDSYISEIHIAGRDSQGILVYGSQGPILLQNNFISAGGENILFGGVSSAFTIKNLVPSDITVKKNHLFKPLSWIGAPFVIKNIFELKNARRLLLEGNVLENNWGAGQPGHSVLLTPRNQVGDCPHCTVEDVTIRLNIIKNVTCAISVGGGDTEAGRSLPTARVLIENDLVITNSSLAFGGCPGRFYDMGSIADYGDPHDITIDHNTGFDDGAFIFASDIIDGKTPKVPNSVFTNNIAGHGSLGVFGAGATDEGTASLNVYFPRSVYSKNAMYGPDLSAKYPTGNFFPADTTAIGFVDFAGGDYHLAPTSPFKNAGTDRKDLGADIDAVNAATAGVVQP